MTEQNPGFIHLHVHSAYSLAEGAIKIPDLVSACAKTGMPAVAVTDTNNMFGAMEFSLEASKNGVQPIHGVRLRLEDNSWIVLLVMDEGGYRNLCALLSDLYMNTEDHTEISCTFEKLKKRAEGLICITGGHEGPINKKLAHGQAKDARDSLLRFKEIFADRLYIEVQRHGYAFETQTEPALIDLAYDLDLPLVATNACYFMDRKGHEAHDALLCIAEGRYVTEQDRRKVNPDHYLKSPQEMCELFADLPEAVQNTIVIAQRCSFFVEPIDPILPAYDTEGGRSEYDELEAQSREGLKWRLENFVTDGDPEVYKKRLDYELKIIKEMGFPGYFLIVSDFIKWAKEQDIPVGPGRGSGGGSVVAWALKITDLDPIALNLLFERFLNPERVSMPDFDIDFCQERRDEVIHYVQEKYGYDRVAQIITYGKLQARAVVRDVGRVLQMPYGQVDRLAKMIPNNPANPITLQQALEQDKDLKAEAENDELQAKLINIALQLEGLYRHASTHAAGVVIGDRPLQELVPLYRDPRSEMPVTQFNMKYVEKAGLVKFDFLGLKTMTVIHKAVKMIKENKGDEINILDVPFDDEKTFKMLKAGENIGVFQVESAGMRDLGKQIGISNLEELLAVIALFRPGPMENIPVYLQNVKNPSDIDFMHEKLKPITEDTYGVMIYQEQVMQAAQVLAGYTLGGADLLRRAMGKKIKEEMDAQRQKFLEGAKKHNDIEEKKANHIFDQIAAFAGYGFNKAHTAGYGLVSYWTGWLKANYPQEFMAASMTLDMGNTDKLAVFKQDMDRMKMPLYGPDVNKSQAHFTVEGKGVRYALGALKGVGEQAMRLVIAEREANGPFESLDDFASRIDAKTLNRRQLEQLAKAGAFDSLNNHRAQVTASAELIIRYAQSLAQEKESGQVSLFGSEDTGKGLGLPELPKTQRWDALEQLANEFAAVGFYLSAHPLDSRQEQFENLKIATVTSIQKDLENIPAGRYQIAGVLLKKQEKISQRGSKYAFLQLSDPTGVYEVTLFSEVLTLHKDLLNPGEMLLLNVDAEMRDDQIRMTVNKIQPLETALEGKIRTVSFLLSDVKPVSKLKEFLSIEGEGKTKISLSYQLEDQSVVHFELPGRWNLSMQARNIIKAEPGVLEVKEA